MAGPKRKPIEREADYVIVADLYRKGWTMRDIASEITRRRPYSLSYSQVKHDLDKILKRWREKQSKYLEDFIVIQIQQIQLMKKECWKEYERSKHPTKKISEKRKVVISTGVHRVKGYEDLHAFELDSIFADGTKALDEAKQKNNSLDDVEIQLTDLSKAVGVEINQDVQLTERLGDHKWIELVAKLMEQEARLLGFYNADKVVTTETTIVVKLPDPISQNSYLPDSQTDEQN